jgi:hypothetical protein
MPAGKFKLNRATVGQIMKTDPALAAAVDGVAADLRGDAGPNATVDTYTTDRHVAGIVVRAIDQARNGALSRAVGRRGGRIDGRA